MTRKYYGDLEANFDGYTPKPELENWDFNGRQEVSDAQVLNPQTTAQTGVTGTYSLPSSQLKGLTATLISGSEVFSSSVDKLVDGEIYNGLTTGSTLESFTGSDGSIVEIDLGDLYTITEIRVLSGTEAGGSQDRAGQKYSLEVLGDEGSTYLPLTTVDFPSTNDEVLTTISDSGNPIVFNVSKLRFQVENDSNLNRETMYREISVLGTPSSIITGLTNYWKLDEASGTRFDSVGAGDFTDNNTVTSSSAVIGNGATFNGVDEYLSTSSSILPTGSFTIAFWVKLLDISNQFNSLVSNFNNVISGQEGFKISFNGNGDNDFRFLTTTNGTNGTRSVSTFSVPNITTNEFSFIVVTFNSSTLDKTLSVNALDPVVDSVSDVFISPAVDFMLGRASSTANPNYTNCVIDELGIWDRVLSRAEIKELYNLGRGLPYPLDPPYTSFKISGVNYESKTDIYLTEDDETLQYINPSTSLTIFLPETPTGDYVEFKIENLNGANDIIVNEGATTLLTLNTANGTIAHFYYTGTEWVFHYE